MKILSLSSPPLHPPLISNNNITINCPTLNPITKLRSNYKTNHGANFRNTSSYRQVSTVRPVKSAVNDVSATVTEFDPDQAQLTWQIIVGALAGVTPFIVAGIEFSKRIVAQRQCKVCGGSGLVLRDKKYYFKCPNCGGFLPWQSWKRFFSG